MKSMVFISGATGGLGKAFAVECASRGWDLFLTDLSAERLASLAKGLQNTYGVEVRQKDCDLTDLPSRSRLFETLKAEGLQFWGLINVAGVDFEGPFLEQTREAIRTIIRLNIEATLDVTHELLERTDPSKPFRIITVASLAAFYPMPVKATYAASKQFLVDFSLALRDELRGHGRDGHGALPGRHAHHARMHRWHRGAGPDGSFDHPEHRNCRSEHIGSGPAGTPGGHPGSLEPTPANGRQPGASDRPGEPDRETLAGRLPGTHPGRSCVRS